MLDGDEEVKTLSDDSFESKGNVMKLKKLVNKQTVDMTMYVNNKDLTKLIHKTSKDGFINYEDFITNLNGSSDMRAEKVLKSTFLKLDTNGDGTVTSTELKKLLLQSDSMNDQEQEFFKQIMNEMDTNMDQKITYPEFKTLMHLLIPPAQQIT